MRKWEQFANVADRTLFRMCFYMSVYMFEKVHVCVGVRECLQLALAVWKIASGLA